MGSSNFVLWPGQGAGAPVSAAPAPSAPATPTGGSGAGNNQYGSWTTGLPSPTTSPGVVPAATSTSGNAGGTSNVGQGNTSVPTLFPQFSQDFFNYLQGQIGQGVAPFNLSTTLPSTGAATAPGTLNAPLTPLLQQLQSFYNGGASTVPGSSQLAQMAQTGDPITQLPAWQAAVAAMNQNTQTNAANLREQYAFAGNLNGTPFAQGMQQFYNQNALNQNALLASTQAQALQQANQNMLTAGTTIASQAATLGGALQGLDQNAINNMLQEFMATQPQYNPLVNMMFGGATTFAPTVKDNTFSSNLAASTGASLGNALGSFVQF